MLSKRELLKALVGKKVIIRNVEAEIAIDARPGYVSRETSYHEITAVGEDMFETIYHISPSTKDGVKIKGYHSIEHVLSIIPPDA